MLTQMERKRRKTPNKRPNVFMWANVTLIVYGRFCHPIHDDSEFSSFFSFYFVILELLISWPHRAHKFQAKWKKNWRSKLFCIRSDIHLITSMCLSHTFTLKLKLKVEKIKNLWTVWFMEFGNDLCWKYSKFCVSSDLFFTFFENRFTMAFTEHHFMMAVSMTDTFNLILSTMDAKKWASNVILNENLIFQINTNLSMELIIYTLYKIFDRPMNISICRCKNYK